MFELIFTILAIIATSLLVIGYYYYNEYCNNRKYLNENKGGKYTWMSNLFFCGFKLLKCKIITL